MSLHSAVKIILILRNSVKVVSVINVSILFPLCGVSNKDQKWNWNFWATTVALDAKNLQIQSAFLLPLQHLLLEYVKKYSIANIDKINLTVPSKIWYCDLHIYNISNKTILCWSEMVYFLQTAVSYIVCNGSHNYSCRFYLFSNISWIWDEDMSTFFPWENCLIFYFYHFVYHWNEKYLILPNHLW